MSRGVTSRNGVITGLEALLARSSELAGRRYALLAHGASVTADLRPAHLALAASGHPPAALMAPEHGYYGVEQDMVAAAGGEDPWTGLPVVSLYGDDEGSLRPDPSAFEGLDLLVVDLQDIGSRYYTYAATAVWAAEAAARVGCEVWLLDRPNPLGGEVVEGNLPEPGYESFVSAFPIPVRHGLTLGEIVLLEARSESSEGGFEDALRIWSMEGWRPSMTWLETGLPWVAPSPNMPTLDIARIYPGGCLVEATEVSEGRGTTRPFQLTGAPGVDPVALVQRLTAAELPGVRFLPTYFRPQFQKHAGEVCGGVEILVTDAGAFRAYRTGVELLAALREVAPEAFRWRSKPYEFVSDRAAIDLLAGGPRLRQALEGPSSESKAELQAWIDSWPADEEAFRRRCAEIYLYPRQGRSAQKVQP
ncbi:MAG: DUF1343 domain-containing protein [Acidobacteriota bacterium]|nr:DUF1343 domain-containing protein [Acidobacteriota bacterium]